MRDFLLDTQTIRYWHDSACAQHATVSGNVAALRKLAMSLAIKPKLLISVVTLGEIEFGHQVALAPNPAAQAAYMKFVREELPASWEVSEDAARAYGELRARLFNKYAPGDKRKPKMLPEQLVDPATARELGIQENDLWISAQAMAHGMVLVTNDRMERIRDVASGMNPGLLIQNWTQPGVASIPS
ncbi:MAG: type II toxin-antitoxin system VapC family toxin [Phycisphaerales bacterium]|nr:type II toxin-antitoxin system VapC family toxin [Phycisphaerales bacterium]